MNRESSTAIYFISVASTLSGIHQQTIRSYEEKGLIKPYRTGGGTRRYSQSDIDKLIQIQDLSQRGINLDEVCAGCYFKHKTPPTCPRDNYCSKIKADQIFKVDQTLIDYFVDYCILYTAYIIPQSFSTVFFLI